MEPIATFLERLFDELGTVVLIVLGLIVSAPYVLGPLLIKSTHKFHAVPRLKTFDPERDPPPPQVAAFFAASLGELEKEGFSTVAHVIIPDQVPNVATVMIVLENRAQDDAAIVVSMYALGQSSGGRRPVLEQNQYVEFSCDFTDGSQLSTNNTQAGMSFPPVPERKIVQFPEIASAAHLYRLHQRAVEEFASARKKPLPPREALVDRIGQDMMNEFETHVGTGYLFRAPKYFRPTWKGAILMTWKELWPISTLRRAQRRNRARRLLRQWDIRNPAA